MANSAFSATRPVVEKELLHYEIFQALDAQGLLKDLASSVGALFATMRSELAAMPETANAASKSAAAAPAATNRQQTPGLRAEGQVSHFRGYPP